MGLVRELAGCCFEDTGMMGDAKETISNLSNSLPGIIQAFTGKPKDPAADAAKASQASSSGAGSGKLFGIPYLYLAIGGVVGLVGWRMLRRKR